MIAGADAVSTETNDESTSAASHIKPLVITGSEPSAVYPEGPQ